MTVVAGCSKPGTATTIPGPVMPNLTAEKTYRVGEEIVLRLEWPASDWRLNDAQRDRIGTDDFWPFHVRINGRELPIRSGLSPFSGLASDRTLSDDLHEDLDWQPGEYRIAYVLKDLKITHPGPPQTERQLDEWRSNEVVFRIDDGEDP